MSRQHSTAISRASTETQAAFRDPAGPRPSADIRGQPRRALGVIPADGLFVAGLLAWALWLQRPWRELPLPVTDMGGILAMFGDTTSFLDRAGLLIKTAALEGRFMPASMVALAAKIHLLGAEGADWRWGSFVLSGALVVAAYLVLRRFGVVAFGAFVGASLFIYGDPASPAWLLPQVMEPIAALFVIGAVALAQRYRTTLQPTRDAIVISLCLVAAIWVKEPLIAVAPFVLLTALWWSPRGWDMSVPGGRVRQLLASSALLITLLNIIPIVLVRLGASDPDYASRYSISTLSGDSALNALRASVLPVTRVLWFPANLAAAVVVLAGVWIGARQRPARQVLLGLGIPLILPLSIALIYSPWPSFPGYYALPGTFGVALAIGLALTEVLDRANGASRAAVVSACGGMALLGSVIASSAVAFYGGERTLELRLARHLGRIEAPAVLAYGVRSPHLSGSYGSGLLSYARVFSGPVALSSALDVSCDHAARLATSAPRDTVVVTYIAECPLVQGEPSVTLRETVRAREWKTLRTRVDTVGATVVGARPTER